jgi:gliding motility-associated-like protein
VVSNNIPPFALSGGMPVGGTYTGTGVTSNLFDPKTAGIGIHQITYIYTNPSGCSDSATATIEVIDGSAVITYTALTPNGDGIDDTWIIKNIDKFPGNKVQIFNRWGTKVFEATNYKNDWNGGNLPQASYFYLLDLNNGDAVQKGTVTIIR